MKKLSNSKVTFSVVVVLITVLSFTKILDNYADTYTTEAFTSAAITYAAARGINAVVSTMQTTTIEIGIGLSGSLTVGELLDPINDLIERFSSIMTLVLVSLAGQKILLLISSNFVFQVLITLFGLLSISALFFEKLLPFKLLFNMFLILVFVRFSLGFAGTLNSGIDKVFLVESTSKYDSELQVFSQELSGLGSDESVRIQEIQRYKDEHKQVLEASRIASKELKERIIPAKNKAGSLLREAVAKLEFEKDKLGLINKYNVFKDQPELEVYKKEVDAAENKSDKLNKMFENHNDEIEKLQKDVVALEDLIKGEPTGILGSIKMARAALMNSTNINKIKENINSSIKSFINLIALYLMKTIIFPLFFFYAFVILIKKIWSFEFQFDSL